MNHDLKPCPFCGSEDQVVFPPSLTIDDTKTKKPGRFYSEIHCRDCGAGLTGPNFDQDCKQVVALWNKRTITCHLTYFRKNGKYYSDGKFEVPDSFDLYEVWEIVRGMRDAGILPGLVDGAREYSILINVPGHRHEHPHLIP
jgi:Lar family restriction alleviation protein